MFSMLNMRSVDQGDLTAKAGIRNAALRLFAEQGHQAVSVRQIAEAAGVSPALVLHHFGSKDGLREAVDRYAAAQFDAFLEAPEEVGDVLTSGSNASMAELIAKVLPPGSPLPAYLRRLLLEGDPAGRALFRRWYEVSRALVEQLIAAGFATPTEDPDVMAAFMLTADLALLVLRDPLTDALGFDPVSPDGLTRWAAEVARIYRDGAFVVPEDTTDQPADR
jgi:TetR/AcrR family transcriptional regulator, regulator of cefoperazone and chloramphenicol sensitivity